MILLYVPEARGRQRIDPPAGWSVLLESSGSYGAAVPPLQSVYVWSDGVQIEIVHYPDF